MGREGEGMTPEDVDFKAKNEISAEEAPVDRPLLKVFTERFGANSNMEDIAEDLGHEQFNVTLPGDDGKEFKFIGDMQSINLALERTKGSEEAEQVLDILEKAFTARANKWEDVMKDAEQKIQVPFGELKNRFTEQVKYVQRAMEAAGKGPELEEKLDAFFVEFEKMYQTKVEG